MSAPARKRTAAKKPSAAVAARREVRGEGRKVPPVSVKFRSETFDIPRDRLGSARVLLRFQHLESEATIGNASRLLFDMLGTVDAARFIDLCKPGEEFWTVYGEWMTAFRKASNVPNS